MTKTETVNLRGMKLVIATPTEGPSARFLVSLLDTTQFLTGHSIAWRFIPEVGDSLVQRARNNLVARAMEDDTMTHFLFIDSDLGWEPKTVTDLVGGMLVANHDVACVVYPKKTLPIEWPSNFVRNDGLICQHPESGFVELKDAPTGFLCVTRQALLRMMNAYPERKCNYGPSASDIRKRYSYDLFSAFIEESTDDRRFLSEDFGFCRLWQGLGGRVWAHSAGELTHEGPYPFKGKLSDSLRKATPAVLAASEVEGWMTVPELSWLEVEAAKADGCIEVGSWAGRSSLVLAKSLKAGRLWCVDTWKGTEGEHTPEQAERARLAFHKNLSGECVSAVCLPSVEAAKSLAAADMVFIDGDHSETGVRADIEAYLPLARKLICGHDYRDKPGVKAAVDAAFGERVELPVGTDIWAVRL